MVGSTSISCLRASSSLGADSREAEKHGVAEAPNRRAKKDCQQRAAVEV